MNPFRLATVIACIFGLITSCSAHAAPASSTQSPTDFRGAAGDADHLSSVLVNGVNLTYRIEGAGVPAIFVHGEGYSHEVWTRQVDSFSERYQFVSYDRRGHGLSEDPPTGYSVIAHAEDLHALMTSFGMQAAHLIVHSRGGAIAIQFLRMYPEKVRSITFADATIPLTEIADNSAFKSSIGRLKGPPPTLQEALRKREGAKTSAFTRVSQSRADTNEILRRMVDQYSPRVAMNRQRSDMASPMDLGPWNSRDFPDVSQIHQPTLLIVAELSDVYFKDGAAEAHRLWPNSRLVQMPTVDHLLMLEDPEAFNRLVLAFLAEVDAQIAKHARWSGTPTDQ